MPPYQDKNLWGAEQDLGDPQLEDLLSPGPRPPLCPRPQAPPCVAHGSSSLVVGGVFGVCLHLTKVYMILIHEMYVMYAYGIVIVYKCT